MSIEIKLPQLGDGIDTADVLEILVNEGDEIEKDQGILELETDKATAVVPSTHAGTVAKIHVAEGDTIPVGTLIVTLDGNGGSSSDAKQQAEETEESEKAQTAEAEQQAVPEASKPPEPAEVEAEESEVVEEEELEEEPTAEPVAEESTTKSNGRKKAEPKRAPKPEPAPASSRSMGSGAPAVSTSTNPAEIPAGPAMRRFAREVGVDLGQVSGSGEGGRITRDDILRVVRSGGARSGQAPDGLRDDHGPIRQEKMSRIRRTIARQMHESWTTVPRVTNFDDADVTDLENIRKSSKEDYAARGIKLTSMPFVIKAVAMALRKHPLINASVDLDAGQIIYKEYINIGIAVDTERGLVVPSLRNADDLSIPDIAKQLAEMAKQVRDNQFTVEDLRGSTFTISNLGAIGGTYSTPIINVPETAILLIGRSRLLPVVKDDAVVPRLMMPLSISYDHRLIDGGAAARFLNEVIGYLRAPSRLLLAP